MERDIEKILIEIECAIKSQEEKDNVFTMSVLQRCHKLVSRLKEYKDLEEQGKLLKLPCAVGGKVYKFLSCGNNKKTIAEFVVCHIDIDCFPNIEFLCKKEYGNRSYCFSNIEDFGKTVFLTREAAEAALKEL